MQTRRLGSCDLQITPIGVRRSDQVSGVIGAAEFRLAPDEIKEIEEFKL